MSKKEFTVRPFAKLRQTLERKQVATAPPPSRPQKRADCSDDELFRIEMDDVQEIEAFRLLACDRVRRPVSGPAPADPEHESLAELAEIAAGRRPIPLPHTQEYVQWVNPCYHEAIVRKLHEGHFAVQAFLDLHGCTRPDADGELDRFLEESFRKGYRCVKVIHGRGLRSVKGPALKEAVIRRLSGHHRREIIAFVSARQCDGGLGALYVLLHKR